MSAAIARKSRQRVMRTPKKFVTPPTLASIDRAHVEACKALEQRCGDGELTLLAIAVNISVWAMALYAFL